MTNQERMKLAGETALAAGKMLLEYTDLHVDRKSRNDYVTDADRASEEMIRKMLLDACPEDGFFGEESGVTGAEVNGQWVVDPIDGTTNFIHSLHPYTISIGYMKDGQPVAGAVYAPLTNELFTAYQGGGAYRNGKRIHVSNTTEPSACILGMSFSHRTPNCAARMFELIPRLATQLNDMRRLGSAAYDLCNVACGRYDAFIELDLHLYDICAGILMVREAGGITGGWPNGEDCLITGDTMAVTPGLHDWLRAELAK